MRIVELSQPVRQKIEAVLLGMLSARIDPQPDQLVNHAMQLVQVAEHAYHLTVRIPYLLTGNQQETLVRTIQPWVTQALDATSVQVTVQPHIVAYETTQPDNAIAGVKNIIAVGSGKGGVGKSTVTANLAIALQQLGAKVGLLDADIYGPSQPTLLGTQDIQATVTGGQFEPVVQFGLQTMSMGYLLDKHVPSIWRGPMISQALRQLLFQTHWQALDFLLIDLPPGTGDIVLTLAQKVGLCGSLLVTTPQQVAIADVIKAIEFFNKLSIPCLGLIENMSTVVCSACGHMASPFGQGGGQALAAQYGMACLAQLPLVPPLCHYADQGQPLAIAEPNHPVALAFEALAETVTARLSLRARNFSAPVVPVAIQAE